MIEEWRNQEYECAKASEPYIEWIKKQRWFSTPDEYSILFERTYDEPSQRRKYIEDCVGEAEPYWGIFILEF